MSKYLETAKLLFKTQLAYRFDTIINMLFTISKIILAYILWGSIFENREIVSGFTLNGMISYYIISSFIVQLDQSSGTGGQIAAEIRGGQFSKYMVRPINIFGYFASQTAGVSIFLLSFNLIAAVLWVFIFGVEFVITNNVMTILSAAVITFLGLIFMMQLNFFTGILAFKFLDISIFTMIKDNVLQFVTGSLIPLAILPSFILDVMKYFPFYYVVYLPAMLFLGKNKNQIFTGIAVLLFWNISFWLINKITYNRLRIKYDGVGI